MELSTTVEATSCNHWILSQHSVKPEGSLLRSQELSTCTYAAPDQSSPHHPHPISMISILMLSTQLRLGLCSALFPYGFCINNP
jgi:hypothetical protein